MSSRWLGTAIAATDPARLARWWAEVLGYRVTRDQPEQVAIGPAEPGHPAILFVPEAQATAGRGRLHLEVVTDDQAAEVERLVDMGARPVDGVAAVGVLLADPEGNEFRVLPA